MPNHLFGLFVGSLTVIASALPGAEERPAFATDVTVGVGVMFPRHSPLQNHAARFGEFVQLDVAARRAQISDQPRVFHGPVALVIGYRAGSASPFTSTNVTEEIYLGPRFEVFAWKRHLVSVAAGSNVITARRTAHGAYATATSVGGWGSLDYRFLIPTDAADRQVTTGASLAMSGTDISVGGSREPIGGWFLCACFGLEY